MLKLGSLFNGVSGWPLAAVHSGAVVPVWASEIDEYPTAVSKAHFPNMKQLGDITKINGADIEPVEIITSGLILSNIYKYTTRKYTNHTNRPITGKASIRLRNASDMP